MTNLTLGIVLDRSGSMHTAWDDTVGAVQEMLDEQAQEGETTIVPVVFDNEIDVLDIVVAGARNPFEGVRPRGSTALYDAIFTGVKAIEKYTPESDKTAVVIATDGHENASTEHGRNDINKLIQRKRDEGWEFIFIGANQDAWATGRAIGTQNNMNWEQTKEGTQMVYDAVSRSLTSYRNQ